MKQAVPRSALLFALAYLARVAHAEPSPMPPPFHMADVLGAIVQGDGTRATAILRPLSDTELSARDAQLRSCMLARIEGSGEGESRVPDAFTQRVLEAYEEYWRRGVVGPSARAPAEDGLLTALRQLLGNDQLADVSSAEPALASRIERAGYHSLQGRTGVLHELMIWSRQTEKQEHVALPEGQQTTHVFLLDGFVSRGWSSYLTCGRTGTGGWTRPEGLYAVVPAYDSLDGEDFRVSFVAHESQHFADQKRFPNLKDWEKEYRAKLVELALADSTRTRVLRYFSSSQGDDPADSHSYANRQVLRSIRQRLGLAVDADLSTAPPERLRQAAVAELRADSARRVRSGG